MTNMIDSLIFDLDGTLWDTTEVVLEARVNVFKNLKVENYRNLTASDIAKTFGLPLDEAYRQLYPDLKADEIETLKVLVKDEIGSLIAAKGVFIYEGVKEGLIELSEYYKLFIVSNCNVGYIENFIDFTKLHHYIRDYECYGNTRLHKAQNILQVIKRNELITPAYIGDTAYDQVAALEANIAYYHMTYGFGDPETPCKTYNSFSELVIDLISLKSNLLLL